MAEAENTTNTPPTDERVRPADKEAEARISELVLDGIKAVEAENPELIAPELREQPEPPAEPEPPVETRNAEPPAEPPEPAPAIGDSGNSLADLAERAGIADVAELYKVLVPLGEDLPPMTLGDLKDKVQDAERIITQRAAVDEHRESFERDMLRARSELNQIVSLLPEVPDELVQQAAAQHTQLLQREREALLGIKPDWGDPQVFASAQDDIMEVAQQYGFTRQDLNTVVDHRLQLLLHGFASMWKRTQAANAAGKEVRQEAAAARKPSARQRGKQPGALQQKVTNLEQAASRDGATDATKRAAVAGILLEAAQKG